MSRQCVMPRPEDSVLLLCDMQNLFRPLLRDGEKLIANQLFLIQCCKEMNIPIIVTEHVKRIFGDSFAEYNVTENATKVIQKTQFSMCTEPVNAELTKLNKRNVIIIGMEAHICILQTVLDLLSEGYNVHIPRDCVTSQRIMDESTAIQRLSNAGACLTTAQSVVFQLLRNAKHPKFKTLQKYIKTQAKL
eukprot:166484_1